MSITNIEKLTYIITNEKRIIVESDFYVPFEPKILKGHLGKKALHLRQDIRDAIGKLKIDEGKMLLASYSENEICPEQLAF